MTNERMIADAKRAARRLARTSNATYQQCLDSVADQAGRRHWADFMANPVDTRALNAKPSKPDVIFDGKPELESLKAGIKLENTSELYELTEGEGIVLGLGNDRLVRSARNATVLCIGDPASGKTAGVVLPTILTSSDASQIIFDAKPELLEKILQAGAGKNRNILALDPLASMDLPKGEARHAYFNPLHPAYYDYDPRLAAKHAEHIADILSNRDGVSDAYFAQKARDLLCALLLYIMIHPEVVPEGRAGLDRTGAALPGLVRWYARSYTDGLTQTLKEAVSIASKDARTADIAGLFRVYQHMHPNERVGVFGTMDSFLLPVKSLDVIKYLEPEKYDDGASTLAALAHDAAPTSIYLVSDLSTIQAIASLHTLAIDLTARWRTRRGPSDRSFQVIIDEGGRIHPSPWLAQTLTKGSSAGISVLVCTQIPTGKVFDRIAPGKSEYELRPDHVICLDPLPFLHQHNETMLRISGAPDETIIPEVDHILLNRKGATPLETPFILIPFTKESGS